MVKTESSPLEHAQRAWGVAGVSFPELQEDSAVKVVLGRGREAELPAEVFGPEAYTFDIPPATHDNESVEEEMERRLRAVYASGMRHDLDKNWSESIHMRRLVAGLIGEPGRRLYPDVLAENLTISAVHKATKAVFAARMFEPGNAAGAPALTVSMWSNSKSPSSVSELHRTWVPGFVSLPFAENGPQSEVEHSRYARRAAELAGTVALDYDGTLSVLAGTNRLDISKGDDENEVRVRHSKIEHVSGTLVVATFLHR